MDARTDEWLEKQQTNNNNNMSRCDLLQKKSTKEEKIKRYELNKCNKTKALITRVFPKTLCGSKTFKNYYNQCHLPHTIVANFSYLKGLLILEQMKQ